MPNEPVVIAEIGCVHVGNMDRAKELIRLAKLAGANVAKFQKRNPLVSVPKYMHDNPHPNKRFAYGETYLEHRQNLEMSAEQHVELKAFCDEINIDYSTSVWDLDSAKEIIPLNPKLLKIPSAQNHNWDLINYLYDNYGGEVHISQGMTTPEEREEMWNKLRDKDLDRTVVYHCTSAYPCPFESLYIKEISLMTTLFKNIGFSNHGYGIACDVAAFALGARWFERHFVDDRTFPHTDACASLEATGMSKLCRDLRAVSKAMRFKPKGLDGLEQEQRDKLRG